MNVQDTHAIPTSVTLNGVQHEVVAVAYVPKRPGLRAAHVVAYRVGETYNVHYLIHPSSSEPYLHQGSYDLTYDQAVREFIRRLKLEQKE